MTRQEKYPDTSTFHFYNANPHGRYTDDCVIRAICRAANEKYETVLKELTEICLKTGFTFTDKCCYEKYLLSKGWIKHNQPRKADNTKYTGKEFCERCRDYENYIAHIGGHHIVAIVDGKVNDVWDSTNGCIGNYWTK